MGVRYGYVSKSQTQLFLRKFADFHCNLNCQVSNPKYCNHSEQRCDVELQNSKYCHRITKEEIKDALRKMKARKAIGPDNIPPEFWKCLGDEGLEWLTKLFNSIFGWLRCHMNGDAVQLYSDPFMQEQGQYPRLQ